MVEKMTPDVLITDLRPAEIMIAAIARMLDGLGHVAVGAQSPIPGSAALLAQARSGAKMRVSILGSTSNNPFTDGGKELFDAAGQGRIDAFFLSGGQIDGAANVNLVGVGDVADYPRSSQRFPGSFGSAYLYYVVPRVILFREEHSPRVLVEKVDFISAPGTSPATVYRPGGPFGLVTPLCVFAFNKTRARFTLASLHPGVTAATVRAATGFDYDAAATVPVTAGLSAADLAVLRGDVARRVAETYPAFARKTWSIETTTQPPR
jgi:glutaconate CoA-transferase, subunit B